MSDSVWPHRQQPTRLPRPWDSPGKNTGVGFHFLLQCMKVKVKLLNHVWLLVPQWNAAYQAPPSMGFSRQEYLTNSPQLTRFLHTSRHLHGVFPVPRRQIPCKGCGEWLLRADDSWRPRSGSQLTETLSSTNEFQMLIGISRKNNVSWKKLVYQYIAFLCFPNRGQKTQVWVPALSLGKQLWPLWTSV